MDLQREEESIGELPLGQRDGPGRVIRRQPLVQIEHHGALAGEIAVQEACAHTRAPRDVAQARVVVPGSA